MLLRLSFKHCTSVTQQSVNLMALIQGIEMDETEDDEHPLVIDTSTAGASHVDADDQPVSEVGSAVHTDVDQDTTHRSELSSSSPSSAVLPFAVGGDDDDLDENEDDPSQPHHHHREGSVSGDSQSTTGSPSKDLTGSASTGDLSPGSGATARSSKSRRDAVRVRTTAVCL